MTIEVTCLVMGINIDTQQVLMDNKETQGILYRHQQRERDLEDRKDRTKDTPKVN